MTESEVRHAIIVDIETTGLTASEHEIIEIGIIKFSHCDFNNPIITSCYGGLAEPLGAITPEITKITGLTAQAVKGQAINWHLVAQLMADADLTIAHNASFDRSFLEAVPEVAGLWPRWACSMKHIDWQAHGSRTRALNYLACDQGFINPFAHRAVFDCATTYRLAAPHLRELYETSKLREFKIEALGAPFEVKDKLKQRGYRWDAEARVWFCHILENRLADERDFLSDQIYAGRPRHQELEVSL